MNETSSQPDLQDPFVAGAMTGLRAAAGLLAVVAALLMGVGYSQNPDQAAFSYLVAFLFLLSLAVGALFWILLHYLTAAVWSVVLRRLTEHLASLIIPSAVLFIPLLLGMQVLFRWSVIEEGADVSLAGKSAYLNATFFLVRGSLYFVIWLALLFFLRRASLRQDQSTEESCLAQVRKFSAFGMLLLALTTTFAAFDWVMSLDPHWYSNIFGVYFWSGSILGSLAAVTLLALGARRFCGLHNVITVEHLHDLGKLLFGFTVFWAYIAFSQYFLIWYAAIPEETTWYALRMQGEWRLVSGLLLICHFVVPFVALLPRAPKRSPLVLGLVALWLLVFHGLDLYWQVMPTLHPQHAGLHWLDLVAWLFVVALTCVTIAQVAKMRPLIPLGDPDLAASIDFENE